MPGSSATGAAAAVLTASASAAAVLSSPKGGGVTSPSGMNPGSSSGSPLAGGGSSKVQDSPAALLSCQKELLLLLGCYLGHQTVSRVQGGEATEGRPPKVRRLSSPPPAAPPSSQFPSDFRRLAATFQDATIRAALEPLLADLLLQCSCHAVQVKFLLGAVRFFRSLQLLSWSSFTPLFLNKLVKALQHPPSLPSAAVPNPLSTQQQQQQEAGAAEKDVKEVQSEGDKHQHTKSAAEEAASSRLRQEGLPPIWMRQVACRLLLLAVSSGELNAATCFSLLQCLLGWMRLLQREQGETAAAAAGSVGGGGGSEKDGNVSNMVVVGKDSGWTEGGLLGWGGIATERQSRKQLMDILLALLSPDKCLVPFYALLQGPTQLQAEYLTDLGDPSSLLALEVDHRCQSLIFYLTPPDFALHGPSFATPRSLPFTFRSRLGEPLYGQEIAEAIPYGSLDWHRAIRTLRQALRSNVNSDFWRRLLVHAPLFRKATQPPPAAAAAATLTQQQQQQPPPAAASSAYQQVPAGGGSSSLIPVAATAGSAPTQGQGGGSQSAAAATAVSAAAPSVFPTAVPPLSYSLSHSVPQFSPAMICHALVDHILHCLQLSAPCSPVHGTSQPAAAAAAATAAASDPSQWQQWLSFGDTFYFIMRNGFVNFVDFVALLSSRFVSSPPPSNHITWLLAQVFRLDTVNSALSSDPNVLSTVKKVIRFQVATRGSSEAADAGAVLLEFVGSVQILRLWNMRKNYKEELDETRLAEYKRQGMVLDEFWKKVLKGEKVFGNLDERSVGMVWVLSHTMSQPVTDNLLHWLKSQDVRNITVDHKTVQMFNECPPLSVSFLQGLSLQVLQRLATSLQDIMANSAQLLPSIAMVETFVRLLLVAPHTLSQIQTIHPLYPLASTNRTNVLQAALDRFIPGETSIALPLLLLEIINYRLIPFFRFHGKVRGVILDLVKILIRLRQLDGQHRLYRLAENTALNLILCLREVMLVKKDSKTAATELSETLNRMMVANLAMTVKVRGMTELEQVMLSPALEQMMANSSHKWSSKTLRHMPQAVREAIQKRTENRSSNLADWQRVEQEMLASCRRLLQPSKDSSLPLAFAKDLPRSHRPFVCAAAWLLMDLKPDSVNLSNLALVMREFSPDDVTRNAYVMVDVLLHNIQMQQIQLKRLPAPVLLGASTALADLCFNRQVLPADLLLLALADRDDNNISLRLVVGLMVDHVGLKSRVASFCSSRSSAPHHSRNEATPPADPLQALGSHLMGKENNPVFFDHAVLRLVPIIPFVVHRLIENDAFATAERLLALYNSRPMHMAAFHPARFGFVRDCLTYFHPLLPPKLVLCLLNTLDLSKVHFTPGFMQLINPEDGPSLPPVSFFSSLLHSLAEHAIAPTSHRNSRRPRATASASAAAAFASSAAGAAAAAAAEGEAAVGEAAAEAGQPDFEYLLFGGVAQMHVETAAVEILSLPPGPSSSLPTSIVHRLLTAATDGFISLGAKAAPGDAGGDGGGGHGSDKERTEGAAAAATATAAGAAAASAAAAASGKVQSAGGVAATTPGGESKEASAAAAGDASDHSKAPADDAAGRKGVKRNEGQEGMAGGRLRVELLQVCGILLASLPVSFQTVFFSTLGDAINSSDWVKSRGAESDADAFQLLSMGLNDAAWSSRMGLTSDVGLLFSILNFMIAASSFDRLESVVAFVNSQRPVKCTLHLRLMFRILAPLIPRLTISKPQFAKLLSLLLACLSDVFGNDSEPSVTGPASSVSDLVDVIYHAVIMEGGTASQPSRKPKAETLLRCTKALERMRPDMRVMLRHLSGDPKTSVFAASNPKTGKQGVH